MTRATQHFLPTIERIGVNLGNYQDLRRILELCGECDEIAKIDHITFVCAPSERDAFLERWEAKGFSRHGIWQTKRFPADHIALIRGESDGYPWTDMVGLSVQGPKCENRPLSESVRPKERDQTQHIAFNVNAEADIETLYARMSESWGLTLMTPILSYTDDHGAGLRQWFTAPVDGFFIEFVQRIANAQGEPYSGFDPDIIDDLYQALDAQIPMQAA